ncbi:L,D-transpeptidase family protein [Stappia sp. F7233]|uniref:L,D-transpeptidase family protein n=1 Tax=Stappia albiluteola TaxID=2758565 RepID=A0A839AG00_9HYPH|nr:L,D-transpeptidase family protein [Stappia albiluteola]MBA5778643.1 L,D-transpeptidase family protein [Stappia albiluteola]
MLQLKRGTLAGLLCAVATAAMLAPSGEANAQGFLDRIFNPRHYEEQRRQREVEQKPAPVKAYVASPRYYTYAPDKLKVFSLKDLAVVPATALPSAEQDGTPAAAADVTGSVSDANAAVETVPSEERAFNDARTSLADISIRALPEVGKTVVAHYEEYPAFIWVSNGEVSDKARVALQVLGDADRYGLDPADYAVALPDPASGEAGLMRFEMQLSAATLTYVLDAMRGRIDPNRLSGYHDLPRKDVDLAVALKSMAASDDVAAYLERRNPQNAPFQALVAELAALKGQEDGARVEIAEGTLLKPGQSNPELVNVVAAIRLNGSDKVKAAHQATLDAYQNGHDYTPELVALVKDFQKDKGLTQDGVVGSNTIRALQGVSLSQKIARAELALERLRWLPRQLGERHVFINQPAFTATYLEDGKEPLSMRAVVGQKSNQTYFFTDKVEIVEYNPYWGVPYSIIVNEMLPKLNQDPYYLDRLGYEVTTANGRPISSASVDWHSVAAKKLAINVRQQPGDDNALGELKILFPNKHAIYMHDTPAKRLFQRDSRAFSHGCVRLENPRAMAAAVLGKSVDYVSSQIAVGKNHSDDVAGDLPVYVAYFTAWPKQDGQIGYYADVYDRDVHLQKAIDATTKERRG